MPARPARGRPRQMGSRTPASLNLRRGAVGGALVVDPAYLQVVVLLGALEGELDIGVLGNAAAPVGDEHTLAVMLEDELLDEMRRNDLALGVLYEAGIHRVLDQRLHLGDTVFRRSPDANARCHRFLLLAFYFAHDLIGKPVPTFPDHAP